MHLSITKAACWTFESRFDWYFTWDISVLLPVEWRDRIAGRSMPIVNWASVFQVHNPMWKVRTGGICVKMRHFKLDKLRWQPNGILLFWSCKYGIICGIFCSIVVHFIYQQELWTIYKSGLQKKLLCAHWRIEGGGALWMRSLVQFCFNFMQFSGKKLPK